MPQSQVARLLAEEVLASRAPPQEGELLAGPAASSAPLQSQRAAGAVARFGSFTQSTLQLAVRTRQSLKAMPATLAEAADLVAQFNQGRRGGS